ncbi:transporter substrate-binding domain-containing protein [Vibrio cholerae]|nr:transporter substrate-binding domain-containing protein [Vibrio cholerae]
MPYWKGSNEAPEGIYHDYAANLGQELNVSIRYEDYDTLENLQLGLEKGDVDIWIGAQENTERNEKFLFSAPLHLNIPMFWFRNKALATMDPKQLIWGCIASTHQCSQLDELGYSNVIRAKSRQELADMVKQNIISAVITTQLDAYYALTISKFDFGHLAFVPDIPITKTRIAITKSKPTLHAVINKTITADEAGFTRQPLQSLNAQLLRSQANIALWQTKQKNQPIKYTIEEDMFPLSYVNSKGEVDGYVHALMQRITTHSPLTFEYVPAQGRDVVQMLKDGVVDILPARNISGVDTRDFLLTTPYANVVFSMLEKTDNTSGSKLAILDRTGNIHSYLSIDGKSPDVAVYRTLDSLLGAMNKGEITHAILNQDLASQLVLSRQVENISLAELPPNVKIDVQLAMVVRNSNPLLHSLLQAGLATVPPHTHQELYNTHRKVTLEIGYSKRSVQSSALIALALFLALTLFSVRVVNRYKRYKRSSESEKRLTEAQVNWLNQLLDSIPNMIAMFDDKEQLVLANQSYREYLGKCNNTECSLEKSLCPFRHPRMPGGVSEINREIRDSRCELHKKYYQIAKTRMHALDNGKQYTLVVYNDITNLKLSENKLKESSEKAQKAVQARNDFLAVVSHELRTPIAALIGLLDIVYARTQDCESQLLLENAMLSADRLSLQVNDILDISRIEAQQLQLDITKSRLIEELCPTLRSFEMSAVKKELAFIVNWHPSAFIDAYCDGFRINQILNNLLSNSLKFTDSGKIAVNVDVSESELKIDIIDTGCGMTAAQLSSIFKPFVQADSSITRRYGGSGLGMSIVKSLVELMEGKIDIKSESKLGTRVIVELPINTVPFSLEYTGEQCVYKDTLEAKWLHAWGAPIDLESLQSVSPDDSRKEPHSNLYPDQLLQRCLWHRHQPKTETPQRMLIGHILFADDDPINRLLLQRQLKQLGLTSLATKDGEEALKHLKENHKHFDLLLTDCHMTNMDGFTLAGAVKKDTDFTGAIIACTAEDSRNVSEKARDAQFDLVLFKPYSLEELYTALSTYLPKANRHLSWKNGALQKVDWLQQFPPAHQRDIALSVVRSFSENIQQLSDSVVNLADVSHRVEGAAGSLHLDGLVHLAQQSKLCRTKEDTRNYSERLIVEMNNVIAEALACFPDIKHEEQDKPLTVNETK